MSKPYRSRTAILYTGARQGRLPGLALLVQIVYECSSCEQRYLGSRRCQECNLFCRNLGTGGACASCDQIVTVAELLGC
jgi:hypothetical protein